jgi:hypothetical protein
METLSTLAGALVGIVAGAVGTYFLQRIAYKRERTERISASQRQAYVEFLTAVYELFEDISEVHRQLRSQKISASDTAITLRGLFSRKAQAALDNLRLLSDDQVAAAAAVLWRHMRREPSAIGDDLSWDQHQTWREGYWTARRLVIDAARRGGGLQPLEWSIAGIRSASVQE